MKKNTQPLKRENEKIADGRHLFASKMDIHQVYVVNPAYKFKSDWNNVVLTNNNPARYSAARQRNDITEGFVWRIHPNLAVLFDSFKGIYTLEEVAEIFCGQYAMDKTQFIDTVKPCICNEEPIMIPADDGQWCPIPKNFLIPNTAGFTREYMLVDIDIPFARQHFDLSEVRLRVPNSMTLMLNTTCATDCIYCYADRPVIRKPIPFPRLLELLKEAYLLGMPNVDVDGGDFFLYPHWQNLLAEMRNYDFVPLISTKYPLSEKIVEELKQLNVRNIQLSIDSVDNDELQQMLRVDNSYLERVLDGLRLLDEAGIKVAVRSVITRYNDTEQSLNNTIDVLTSFRNVTHIGFTPAEFSRFKPSDSYFSNRSQLARLRAVAEERNRDSVAEISFAECEEPLSVAQRVEGFPNRRICAGNVHGFFVLPDGKATYCERMYWHPFFILGDLTRQSIMEMWNSKRALTRWNFSPKEVRDESPCKTCDEFEKCRRGLGNCWRLAVDAYGDENYDYPAPNCPKALPPSTDYYIP